MGVVDHRVPPCNHHDVIENNCRRRIRDRIDRGNHTIRGSFNNRHPPVSAVGTGFEILHAGNHCSSDHFLDLMLEPPHVGFFEFHLCPFMGVLFTDFSNHIDDFFSLLEGSPFN